MINIKVPATSANIGPGFDTLGLALNMFNHVALSKRADSIKRIIWETPDDAIDDSINLVKTALEYTLEKYNRSTLGYDLIMGQCDVPMSRGLGSSATAIVAGIYAANYLLDFALSKEEILLYATELEGHPDNVAPAIFGDMVISSYTEGKVIHDRVIFPEDIVFKVFIPDFELSTSAARKVLPKTYNIQQCVFNMSRLGLLINCLYTKRYDLLPFAVEDAVHQPYRLPLIQSAELIFEKCREIQSLGSFISGAGPTLIALMPLDHADTFDKQFEPFLATLESKWSLKTLTINKSGTTYSVES
ncbi:homoserine kinase [Fusibacter paucivorans]|uniref:Homoserine kinase n=1 Tax=Fusibacter paucivorans TaxID=76009 RepID=A0ABS5PQE5_9FIRM|nr:homoserine kinase [Fusibacter paucivorans]MBS7527384.1 homoserine kinase [Fusibacter paucivorans]